MGNKWIISLYILLRSAVEKPSFSSNIVEEIRPGYRNLQIFLSMVRKQQKRRSSELKSSLVYTLKNASVKNFLYRRGGREVVIGEIQPSIK